MNYERGMSKVGITQNIVHSSSNALLIHSCFCLLIDGIPFAWIRQLVEHPAELFALVGVHSGLLLAAFDDFLRGRFVLRLQLCALLEDGNGFVKILSVLVGLQK